MEKSESRICVLTARNVLHNAHRCGIYEGQDILMDIDDVDLLCLKPRRACQLKQHIQQRIVWHDFTRKVISVNMAFEPIRLTKEYDLFVAYSPFMRDLIQVSAVQGWKDYCKTSVCWIDEIYAIDLPKLKHWLPALSRFDHIVLGYSGTVAAMTEAIKRPCHCVPVGVDTIRFSPYPCSPNRVIDIYNMGRRLAGIHQALLDITAEKEMFYVYDTFVTSDAMINDHRQHREMLANIAKRSRYFIVSPSRRHGLEETGNQTEVAFRYYEASAAGAVMIGQIPHCETFRTMFNWPDVVIETQADGSDMTDVISSLAAQPERLLEISRRNAMEALLRHDWAYRWKKILDLIGLEPAPQLEIRTNRLKQLAEQIGNR